MSVDECRLIQLPKVADDRGNLSFAENGTHVPFDIQRVYYLYDVPAGSSRGSHGHKCLQQLFLPICGSFDVVLDDGLRKERYTLDRPQAGLYVCAGMWRTVENFSPDAVCMVLASEKYDEADYLHEYTDFLSFKGISP